MEKLFKDEPPPTQALQPRMKQIFTVDELLKTVRKILFIKDGRSMVQIFTDNTFVVFSIDWSDEIAIDHAILDLTPTASTSYYLVEMGIITAEQADQLLIEHSKKIAEQTTKYERRELERLKKLYENGDLHF